MTQPFTSVQIFIFIFVSIFGNNAEIQTVVPNQVFSPNFGKEQYTLQTFYKKQNPISETKPTNEQGPYSAICWTRILTTVETLAGQILDELSEYALTFEYPSEDDDNKVETRSIKYPIEPSESVRKAGNKITREKKFTSCRAGTWYKSNSIKYADDKKILEVRVSPTKNILKISPKSNIPLDTEVPKTSDAMAELLKKLVTSQFPEYNEMLSSMITDENCEADEAYADDEDFDVQKAIANLFGTKKDSAVTPENLVKYPDDTGVEFCYYKNDYLHPKACPDDKSNIPVALLSDEHRIPVKHVYPDGDVDCYDLGDQSVIKRPCPDDTTALPNYDPHKHLFKYENEMDEYNCVYKYNNILNPTICPEDISEIPEILFNEETKIPVKYVDPKGTVNCYDIGKFDLTGRTCPVDTSNWELYDLNKSLVKYTDDNNQVYCYHNFNVKLQLTKCPKDPSNIPDIQLTQDNRIPVKFVDLQGVVHCFDRGDTSVTKRTCTEDSSSWPTFNPYKNIAKYKDDVDQIYCYYRSKDELQPMTCPENLLNIPDLPITDDNRLPVKYIDPEGVVGCFDMGEHNAIKIPCDTDTSLWPIYIPYRNYVKHTDDNKQEYCYHKFHSKLEPTDCPKDTSNIPEYSLTGENRIPVKYVDSEGLQHCYDVGDESVIKRTCPVDTSKWQIDNPYKNLVKYTDDNNKKHCYIKSNKKLNSVFCPEDINIPEISLSDDYPIPIKYVDPQGVVHCYAMTKVSTAKTTCPKDTSTLPVHNPFKNLVKHTDDNNQEHCYYTYNMSLNPTQCPKDSSNIPEISLAGGKRIPVKYVDPKGIEYCYGLGEQDATKNTCPKNTKNLPIYKPYNHLVKYKDDNNKDHCYHKSNSTLQITKCPVDTSNIPELSFSDGKRIPVKYIDPEGKVHCYSLSHQTVVKKKCPRDTSKWPIYNPYKNLFKFTDDNNTEHCFYKSGINLQPSICPEETLHIPKLPLSKDNRLPVKYVNPKGVTECYELSDSGAIRNTCAVDTTNWPVYNPYKHFVKYTDDNNKEHCYYKSKNMLTATQCPKDTTNIPKLSLSNENPIPVKYIDPKGVVHCYDLVGQNATDIICPKDTTNWPIYNPYKNLVKYIDDNNQEHCYHKSNNQLRVTECPKDTSIIPELSLSEGIRIPVKYIDPKGVEHCYDLGEEGTIYITCPKNTSNRPIYNPYKNYVKYRDDNDQEYCYGKFHKKLMQTKCPNNTSNIPELSFSDGEIIKVKYIDSKGVEHCYYLSKEGATDRNCPLYTTIWPIYNPYKNLVKYKDDNEQEHCYRESNKKLVQTKCLKETSNIPELSFSDGKRIPAKYIDSNGVVHCYDLGEEDARDIICPRDTSNWPIYNPYLVKYKDDNNQEYCYHKSNNHLRVAECPKDTSDIPESSFTDGERIPVKYIDPKGIEHCSDMGQEGATDIICPKDSSKTPIYNPYKNLVKYRDDNDQEHCYRKYNNKVQKAECPKDTSNISELSFNNGEIIKVKYIDSKGVEHCYYLGKDGATARTCPMYMTDWPIYNPYKNLVKYKDDNEQEHCYHKSNNQLRVIQCPGDTSNIPELSLSGGKGISVKYIDPKGLEHCYYLREKDAEDITCPDDTSKLPIYNPYKHLVKYTDDNDLVNCYYKSNMKLTQTKCPADMSNIPELSTSDKKRIPVKYVDPQGVVHCYDVGETGAIDRTCPDDTSMMPMYTPFKNLVKYTDDNNKIHCFYKSNEKLQPRVCLKDTTNIPELSLKDIRIPVKYVDPEGVVHCYGLGEQDAKDKTCPAVTSSLPVYNPFKNLVKYKDDYGQEYCYFKHNMNSTQCPGDTSKIPEVSLTDGKRIPIKYVDPSGEAHCYDLGEQGTSDRTCPEDITNLPTYNPFKDLVKYTDDNNQEHCYYKSNKKLNSIHCPKDTSNIPKVSLIGENRIPVKYVDPKDMVHCYDLGEEGTTRRICTKDTSNLPEYNPNKHNTDTTNFPVHNPHKNYGKYTDDNNKVHCYFKSSTKLMAAQCPDDTTNIPELPISPENQVPVKYIDPNGVVHCYYLGEPTIKDRACPENTSSLPTFNPYKKLNKFIDDNGQTHCYYNIKMGPTQCPADTSNIPEVPLIGNNHIPVKYVNPEGAIECYNLGERGVVQYNCPADIATLPYYNPSKHPMDRTSFPQANQPYLPYIPSKQQPNIPLVGNIPTIHPMDRNTFPRLDLPLRHPKYQNQRFNSVQGPVLPTFNTRIIPGDITNLAKPKPMGEKPENIVLSKDDLKLLAKLVCKKKMLFNLASHNNILV